MLILKGKFSLSRYSGVLGAVLVLAALAWMGVAQVQAAPPRPAPPAQAPDTVAAEFYGWYLDTLGADQDPLSDRHATFNNYVARELTARLVEGLNARAGGGRTAGTEGNTNVDADADADADADYFLQSPGYQSAWRRRVAAATVRQRGGQADVIVTLGTDDGAKRVLALGMVQEAGSWKVRQVVLAEARAGAP